jgi:hypothetical protein
VHVSPCTNCRLDKIPCVRRPPRKPSMTPRSRPRLTTKNIDHSTHSALGLTLATERPGSPRSQEFPPPNMNRLPFSYYVLLNGAPLGRLDENEIAILESRGCLHLPSRPVTESLIVHYFLYIHPSLPILDEPEFWRMYSRPEEYSGQFSLTLFQAMLFAAAPFVPEYVVRQCGFDSLLAAREALYCRAKVSGSPLHTSTTENTKTGTIAPPESVTGQRSCCERTDCTAVELLQLKHGFDEQFELAYNRH